ncbi:MAG: hypothetical protein JWM93_1443 [Frankiales bacterium]|nr:hypothetical protein [Frankiales bacterium]
MTASERLVENVLESAGQAVIAADLGGLIVYWNAAAEKLFGFSREEAMGQPTGELLGAATDDVDGAPLVATVLAGEIWTGPFRVRHKDGTPLQLLVTDSALRDDSGEIVGIVGVSTVLADLRRADKRLDTLETVVDALTDALLIVDLRSATVTDCNAQAENLLSLPREQIVGGPVSALVAMDQEFDLDDVIARVSRGTAIPRLETKRPRGDGSAVPVLLSVTPIKNGRGEVVAAAVIIRDTSELIAVREALRLSEERLLRQFNDTSIPQAVLDLAGRFVDVNAAMGDYLGRRSSDLVGKNVNEFEHPDERETATSARRALADGEVRRLMANRRYVHQDGSVVHGIASEVATMDQSGEPAQINLLIQDVTDVHTVTDALARERATFHRLDEFASDVTLITDARGTITYASAAITTVYGYTVSGVLDRNAVDLLHASDKEVVAEALRRCLDTVETIAALRVRMKHQDGTYLWVDIELTNLVGDATVNGIVAQVRDAKGAIDTEERIHGAQHRYDVLVESADAGVMLTDVHRNITFASRRAAAILRADPADIVGTDVSMWLLPDDSWLPAARDSLHGVSRADARFEIRARRSDGEVASLVISIHPLFDSLGIATGAQTLIVDVTDSKGTAAELDRVALRDPLTGLANRTQLTDRVRDLLAADNSMPLAVLHVDIDDFRRINDSFGAAIGDLVLGTVADRLEELSGPRVTVARHDDDEFLLLLSDESDTADAIGRAEAVRAAVAQPMTIRGTSIVVTVTVGVATSEGLDAEALLGAAESAMQVGRARGGDRVAVFDAQFRTRDLEEWQLRNDLHEALRKQEMTMQYQPLVHLPTGRPIGAEALLRWQHPVHGAVAPDTFIRIAERSRLILELGEFALRAACVAAAGWIRDGMVTPAFRISVNLSVRQLADPGLFDRVQSVLTDTSLPPEALCLEVTEGALLVDGTAAEATMRRLHALGVRLAIDDFGSGFSSLRYLRRLPVDQLKVDRTFVAGLGTNADDSAIVAGLVGLADVLGVACVAEGVETIEQADALRTLGCQYAQGYLFSRPVAEGDLPAVFARLDAATG